MVLIDSIPLLLVVQGLTMAYTVSTSGRNPLKIQTGVATVFVAESFVAYPNDRFNPSVPA